MIDSSLLCQRQHDDDEKTAHNLISRKKHAYSSHGDHIPDCREGEIGWCYGDDRFTGKGYSHWDDRPGSQGLAVNASHK